MSQHRPRQLHRSTLIGGAPIDGCSTWRKRDGHVPGSAANGALATASESSSGLRRALKGVVALAGLALLTLAGSPAFALPDLTATKTNNTGGVGAVGVPFTWSIRVDNIGTTSANLNGVRVIGDGLPTAGLSYGSPSVSASSGFSGSLSCSINSSTFMNCDGNSGSSLSPGGFVTVSFTVTASAAGVYDNPRSGARCSTNPIEDIVESNTSNNDCSDSVAVGTGAVGADLTATKSNNVSGSSSLGRTWRWTLAVANGGTSDATFSSGDTILEDDLPSSSASYGSPTIVSSSGISGTGAISCSISSDTLTCVASGGTVVLSGPTGAFAVELVVTPSAAGTIVNPRSGGACAVDPDGNVTEGDETNNTCSDSVNVAASPDLTATKTNSVGGSALVGVPFTWSITVSNIGGAAANLNGARVIGDGLPVTGMSYGSPSVTASSGLTGSLSCAINSSTFMNCDGNSGSSLAPGGSVTVSFTATASVAGVYDNPRSGARCSTDAIDDIVEADESNNDCSDTVAVGTAVMGVDFTVAKSNSVSGSTALGAGGWTWSLLVANGGTMDGTFSSGQTIVRDDLPSSGLTYGTPTVTGTSGISGTGAIACAVASETLTCVASGGTVTLASTSGAFTVNVPVTPTAAGTYSNPRGGGSCGVDPDGDVTEGDETNNSCSDSVSVAPSPDLTATKTNSTAGVGAVGVPFTWSIRVDNIGGASANLNGVRVIGDGLPTSGLGYGSPSVSASSGFSGSLSCSINASTFMNCDGNSGASLAAGGFVTVSFTATPSAAGVYDNPRSGASCGTDLIDDIVEASESNNSCSDGVTVPTPLPDLTVTKANDVGGTSEVASSWTWSLGVANSGGQPATFSSGETLLADSLPSSGLTYGSPSVGAAVGISGTGTISCSIVSSDLSCVASGGTVILAGSTGAFTVSFSADPSSTGTFDNPRSGGSCSVDPLNVITEDSDANNGCSDSVSVQASPDLVASKTNDTSGAIGAGSTFTWSIQLSNSGAAAVFPSGSVILSDNLPASGATYGAASVTASSGIVGSGTITCGIVSSNLACTASGGSVQFSDPGSFTVSFDVTATGSGSLDNPRSGGMCAVDPGSVELETNEGNNACSDSVTVSPRASLTLTKTDTPDPVAAGGSLTYTLAVANAGPSDASTVEVFDVLPPGVAFDSGASDPACTQPSDLVGFRSSLDGTQTVPPSGSSATARAVLVLDTVANELRFALSVSGVTDTITGASLRLADGTLVHTLYQGSPPPFNDSNPLVGLIQLTQGEADALQVAGSHRLRIDTDVDPAGAMAGTPAETTESPVACDLGTVTSGGNDSAPLVVTVGADQAGVTLDNLAIADSATEDPDRAALPAGSLQGDTASASTSVVAVTDWSITKADSADPVVAGQALTYTLTVTNIGPSNASGATVTDPLPAGTTFASSPDGCVEGGGTVTCAIGALASGGSTSVMFTVNVGAGATGSLSNTATVAGNETDPNAANDSATEMTSVSVLADLSLAKADSPDPVIAGQALTYTLTVTNNGPSSSTGSTVSDPLPAGTTFTSSPDGCGEAGGTVTCPIGALGVGANESVEFTVAVGSDVTSSIANSATVTGNETDPNAANDTANATTAVQVEADLRLSKSAAPDPVLAGNSLVYTLTVTNDGPSDSSGSAVADTLPVGVSFASSPDGCAAAGGVVTCAIGALSPGASQMVQFTVDVASSTVGPLVNAATVSGNETDPNAANDTAMTSTAVDRAADLAVAQVDTPDPVTAGSGLTYALSVTNLGPSDDLATVTVTDTLPGGVTFSSATGTGWICGEVGGVVTCTRSGLAVGAAPLITVLLTVDPPTTGTLTNTVSVASATTDPSPGANDTNVVELTTVETEADLSIVKSDSMDPVSGSSYSYTLEVTNAGPSDARNVVATDVLPADLSFDSSATCTEAAGTVTCDFGTVAAGTSEAQSFTVTVVDPPPATVLNTATVTSDDPDPNLADNSDDEETSFDVVPPQVALVGSVADTGDGELASCETANLSIVSLLVTFDESMRDPPGDADPDDVTNPANFELIAAGADRTFETAACGGPLGDDQLVPASSVVYDDGTFTAGAVYGAPLDDDLYRLLVCDGVTDLAGNPLDGDGDGTGGDAFARQFRVDAENLFENGHFDCDLGGWTPQSTDPAEISWSPDDFEGSGDSGSVAVTNLTASPQFSIGQCADLTQLGAGHALRARYRVSTTPTAVLGLSRSCSFFGGSGCTGSPLGTVVDVVLAEDTGGAWLAFQSDLSPPPQALSASCEFLFSAPDGDSFDANLDFLSLATEPGLIFFDGFESGDTSIWSTTVTP